MSFRFFISYDRRYGASAAYAVQQSLIAQEDLNETSDLPIAKNQNTQAPPALSNLRFYQQILIVHFCNF